MKILKNARHGKRDQGGSRFWSSVDKDMPNTENAPHWAHFQFSAGREERSDAQHKKHGQCRPGFSCWVKGTPKNKKHAHMGVFLVFGGCKLSSDAPNTRDATRCHVSGVRYMGEWYWLRWGGDRQRTRKMCTLCASFLSGRWGHGRVSCLWRVQAEQ